MKDARHILGTLKSIFISSKISTSVFLKKKKDFPVAVKWMSIFEGLAFFGNSTIVYLREICVLLSAKFHPLKTIVTFSVD